MIYIVGAAFDTVWATVPNSIYSTAGYVSKQINKKINKNSLTVKLPWIIEATLGNEIMLVKPIKYLLRRRYYTKFSQSSLRKKIIINKGFNKFTL